MKKKFDYLSSNYIEYKSNGDGSKTLSVEEHVNKITPYLKDINNFKNFDTWEIQLAIATNDDEDIRNQNRGGSYIDSPDWIKNKQATTNLISKKDNKCFRYAVTVALN